MPCALMSSLFRVAERRDCDLVFCSGVDLLGVGEGGLMEHL